MKRFNGLVLGAYLVAASSSYAFGPEDLPVPDYDDRRDKTQKQLSASERRAKEAESKAAAAKRRAKELEAELQREREKSVSSDLAEAKSYDKAFNMKKMGNYKDAIAAFQAFIKAYPNSQLAPAAQYWIGESYFQLKDSKAAIASQQTLIAMYPTSSWVPDAMLSIATIQQTLGEADAGKKTQEDLVAKFPLSDAAEKARKLLGYNLASEFRDVLAGGGKGPEMVVIPAGRFTMGSPEGETGRDKDEGPQREVSVKSFALGKTEVTVGDFRRFARATGYKTEAERDVGNKGCHTWEKVDGKGKWDWRAGRYWDDPGFKQNDRQPVACLSWNDAREYVKWLSGATGKPYRLPSEAEWEYAARAGSTAARYWGNNPDDACRYANVADKTTYEGSRWSTTHECNDGYWFSAPVANYTANAFGLHDMIGNVWEWVEDCYHDSYKGAPEDGSAWTSGKCDVRVLRGGSWGNDSDGARSAKRDGDDTTNRNYVIGFRLARMLP